MNQQIYINEAQIPIKAKLKGLICAITADKSCQFSLYVNTSIIASSDEGVIYFTEHYIKNPILFGAGKCLENDQRLKRLDAVNLCSWRYDGLKLICDTSDVVLTIHTIPIHMFLSI